MVHLFKPVISVGSLQEINLGYWYGQGIRGILIDLDNTISPWRRNDITEEAVIFFKKAADQGIQVILFTNATAGRAQRVASEAGIGCCPMAKKPFPGKYKSTLSGLSLKPSQALAIGDQIFTDTLGGNLAGCVTVLLPPLEAGEYMGTKVLRWLERMIGVRQIPRRSLDER